MGNNSYSITCSTFSIRKYTLVTFLKIQFILFLIHFILKRKKFKMHQSGEQWTYIVHCDPQFINLEHKISTFNCPNNASTDLSL